MSRPQYLFACVIALGFGTRLATAQATSDIIAIDAVTVSDRAVRFDAAGSTHLRVDDTAPLNDRTLPLELGRIANFHLNESGAGGFGSIATLRGLSNTPYFSDPSVALYVDDIPLGNAFTFPTELIGYPSISVLRGPDPAAAGRTGEGGVITFSSDTSYLRQPTGTARVTFGNVDLRGAAIDVRTENSGRADASVSAGISRRDGFVENTTLGTTVDRQRAENGSARVHLRPVERTEITLELMANRHRDGSQPLVPIGGPLFEVARDREGSTDSDFVGAAVKLRLDTDVGRLTSVTSRTRWKLDPYDNRLVLPPPLDSKLMQAQSAWNEEIRFFSGPTVAPKWLLGVWLSDANTDGSANRSILGRIPLEGSSFALRSRTAALFGSANVANVSTWKFDVGARVETIRREFDRSQWVPSPGHFAARRSFDAFLPKLTATDSLAHDTHATFSISTGAKPGGWSAYTDKPALAGFRAENVSAFQAGIDRSFLNESMTAVLRVFDDEIRDYQIERSFTATDYLVLNAPRARSAGAEAEFSWRVSPALTLSAASGIVDTRLRGFVDPFTGTNYSGRRAPYVPDYTADLGAAYHAVSGWFASAELNAVGRTYFDEANTVGYAAHAHLRLDAQLGFQGRHWSASVFGNNVTDERYTTLVIPGVRHLAPGAPRTYGVEVMTKW